jgi:hypothetical protein
MSLNGPPTSNGTATLTPNLLGRLAGWVQARVPGAAAREQPGARAHQLRAIGATRDQRAENYPRWRSAV